MTEQEKNQYVDKGRPFFAKILGAIITKIELEQTWKKNAKILGMTMTKAELEQTWKENAARRQRALDETPQISVDEYVKMAGVCVEKGKKLGTVSIEECVGRRCKHIDLKYLMSQMNQKVPPTKEQILRLKRVDILLDLDLESRKDPVGVKLKVENQR